MTLFTALRTKKRKLIVQNDSKDTFLPLYGKTRFFREFRIMHRMKTRKRTLVESDFLREMITNGGKRIMKKKIAVILTACMLFGLVSGCNGTSGDTEVPKETTVGTPTDTVKDDKPYAGTVLKWSMTQSASQGDEFKAIAEMVERETGIIIEANLVPENVDDQIDKVLVGLMAGDEMDILYYAAPRLKPFINAGVLKAVDEIALESNYDMQEVFGDYLPVFGGKTWGLPAFSDIWLTMYNKKVFDNAGVPYPEAEGWTWEKYIETAKLLTDTENGVYGSLMLDYNNYNYMHAVQSGASHYTKDGLSNYADPAFKNALEFFYGLGNEEKIQPSMLEFKAGNIPWDAFFSQDAEYGMFVCGGWTLNMMAETENYPRDWDFGVLPMPYPEGKTPSTLTVPGCYAIPTTSKNQEAAFAAIACIAENQYSLGYGRVPARRDLTEEEINSYIESDLVKPFLSDGVTVEDIRTAWFDSGRIAYPEKVIGPADAEINSIWVEEGQLYGQGAKSIEDAIEAIIRRAEKAIEDSGETIDS